MLSDRRSGGRWLAVLVVAGAALVGAGLGLGALVFGGSRDTTTSVIGGRVSSRPIVLPAAVGGFKDMVEASAGRGASPRQIASQRSQQARTASATVAAYRRAYGGAAVAFRAYANPELTLLPYAIAVRAPTPGLTIGPVQDAALLGLARPPREVVSVGAVQCQVAWSPVVAGRTPPPSSETAMGCQPRAPS